MTGCFYDCMAVVVRMKVFLSLEKFKRTQGCPLLPEMQVGRVRFRGGGTLSVTRKEVGRRFEKAIKRMLPPKHKPTTKTNCEPKSLDATHLFRIYAQRGSVVGDTRHPILATGNS